MRGLTLLIAALPTLAKAEGGIRTLTCEIVSACQSLCTDITIQLAPIQVDDAGLGQYTISVDGTAFFGANLGPEGPYVWSSDPGASFALHLPRGATVFALHHFDATDPDAPAQATTTYLSCGVS